ncbi:MAG: glycosyltransferase family 2 protein [Candidatus Omnitrophica bacterium]|nr:glycosyltransferase family 2 protein [Candidatus Omnitrophota bacterium]MCM8807595.1 glycosyltransferase family 2 protein [Candidatus Omnitrophota bacterium]
MIEDILIIIPCHNEEKNIGLLLKNLKKNFKNILVVDDGSTDKTREIAEKEEVFVISHNYCKGKGEALKTGFKFALEKDFPAVITIDGDGQHLPEDAIKFVQVYRKKPNIGIIVGKRDILSKNMPLIRKITNISMSFLISLISFHWIPDTQCGYRLINKEVLRKVKLYTSHFETESEILIKAGWFGFKIKSIPVETIYKEEKSKIKPLKDTLRFFKMIIFILFPSLLKNGNKF